MTQDDGTVWQIHKDRISYHLLRSRRHGLVLVILEQLEDEDRTEMNMLRMPNEAAAMEIVEHVGSDPWALNAFFSALRIKQGPPAHLDLTSCCQQKNQRDNRATTTLDPSRGRPERNTRFEC